MNVSLSENLNFTTLEYQISLNNVRNKGVELQQVRASHQAYFLVFYEFFGQATAKKNMNFLRIKLVCLDDEYVLV